MQTQQRIFIYAFLSRLFTDTIDEAFLKDLKNNPDLLETIGQDTFEWVVNTPSDRVLRDLNIDFTSMFVMNTQPVESFILDAKQETLVGLQNPVMQFYFQHGYDVDMNQTTIMAPDHLSIELGFMQALITKDEIQAQKDFLMEHIGRWVIPYMMGMRSMAQTPLYQELCDFVVEFLISDLDYVSGACA